MFAQGLANVWGPLDDVVMGGVSQSGFEVRQGAGEHGSPAGLFSGQVSSSNNGGFASVSPPPYIASPTPASALSVDGTMSTLKLDIAPLGHRQT